MFPAVISKLGDMVCALVQGGGYAEYCTACTKLCLPIPEGMTPVEAASLPETYFTVWSNVFDFGRLKGKENLLVQAGASGIGVAAIQMASAMGHRVFATALTEDNCRACEKLGAERCINSTTENFAEYIKEATGGKGVDVILDIIGAAGSGQGNRLSGRWRKARPDRLSGRTSGNGRSGADCSQTTDSDRFHPATPFERIQGGNRAEPERTYLAIDRRRKNQIGYLQGVSARRSHAGPETDAVKYPLRQDRASGNLIREHCFSGNMAFPEYQIPNAMS